MSSIAEETIPTRTTDEQYEQWVKEEQRAEPGSMFILDDDSAHLTAEVISTGVISLDVALGVGGLPRGRIIELYGPEMSGKTALSLAVACQAQKMGGYVGFIDVEHAFDPSWAERAFGIDPHRCVVAQPDDGLKALSMVEKMATSGVFDVIIVDSVAALLPPAMADGEMGDSKQLGQHAKLMSDSLRRLTPIISNSRSVVIFINQIRINPGQMMGNPEYTTGGRALKFYSSVRIEVRSSLGKRIEGKSDQGDGKAFIGQNCFVTISKNKLAPPFRKCEYQLFYATGISTEGSLVEAAMKVGALTKTGNTYSETATGEKLGVGKDRAAEFLHDDPEMAQRLSDAVYASFD
jgi:recombination protein RecA